MLLGGAICLRIFWLLPNKNNVWECSVCFDESVYVVTCYVWSVCFAYDEGPWCPNPHRMVGYIGGVSLIVLSSLCFSVTETL